MKRIFIFLVGCLVYTAIYAADTNPALVLTLKDGETHTVELIRKPRITIDDDQFTIVCDDISLGFELNNISGYKFQNVSEISAPVSNRPLLKINDDYIFIVTTDKGCDLSLTSTDGIVVFRHRIEPDNSEQINLSDYLPGIYILTVDSLTTKITKR